MLEGKPRLDLITQKAAILKEKTASIGLDHVTDAATADKILATHQRDMTTLANEQAIQEARAFNDKNKKMATSELASATQQEIQALLEQIDKIPPNTPSLN